MQRRRFLASTASLAPLLLPACGGAGPATPPPGPVEVPMEVADPHLSVAVEINGQSLRFALDTGADANILTPATAARLGLQLSKELAPASGPTGTVAPVPWVTIASLAVGGLYQYGRIAYVVPLPPEFAYDGLLGATFFRDFVARFDYAAGILGLTPADIYRPEAGSASLPLQVTPGGKILVQAEAAGVQGWYSVDTGAGNALTLFTPTVERHGLRQRFGPGVRMATGVTASGVDYADVVRVPELVLGPWRLKQPVAELSLATAGSFGSDAWSGNLGGEVWRRFVFSIDMRRGRIALWPSQALESPFEAPKSGLAVRAVDDVLRVIDVVQGSPAAQVGLQAGDTVTALDTRPLAPAELPRLRRALRQPAGTTVTIGTLDAAGQSREVVLVLRELV